MSSRHQSSLSNTFAPKFFSTESLERENRVKGIEGENDFSGKRYVWVQDVKTAFMKGWVVEDLEGGRLLVQCDDGSVRFDLLLLTRANICSNVKWTQTV